MLPADRLRAARAGTLLTGGVPAPVRFVIDGRTGELVMPLPPGVAAAGDQVLFIPHEADDALQLLLALRPLGPEESSTYDRWQAYHGTPRAPAWVAARIEAARLEGQVVDGSEMTLRNPLVGAEAALCRTANADRAALRGACRRAGLEVADPVCVGVDPRGLDVRARFEIVRVPFGTEASTPDLAARAVDALLAPEDDPGP